MLSCMPHAGLMGVREVKKKKIQLDSKAGRDPAEC